MSAANQLSTRARPMHAPATKCVVSLLIALALCLGAMPAMAGDDCEVPVHLWQSRDAVREMAASMGWQVRRLKIDDGCYELRGVDAQGRSFKAKIDPQTLEIVRIKLRKHNDKSRNGHSRARPDAPHGHSAGTS